jgi:hypothetical protein
MDDLKVQGSVPEGGTSLYAFGTPDAKLFVNGILEEWFLDEFPFQGGRRTKHVFGGSGQVRYARLEISPAEIAITAKIECVDAFNGRRTEHTVIRTPAALLAFERVDLPDPFILCCPGDCQGTHSAKRKCQGQPHAGTNKPAPVYVGTFSH